MAHDLRQLSKDWFERVWNGRDLDAMRGMLDPGVITHGQGAQREAVVGVGHFEGFHREFCSAFPDLRVVIEEVLVEGDRSAVRFSFTGTHRAEGLGMGPTGKPFRSTGMAFARWRDGKIVETWNEFDSEWMMRQLQSPGAKMRV